MIQKILEKGILVYCIKEFIGINAVAVWYVWIQAKYNFPIFIIADAKLYLYFCIESYPD